jgi:enamine deaminase RidA (YjgF/YER057c/UK114 family)
VRLPRRAARDWPDQERVHPVPRSDVLIASEPVVGDAQRGAYRWLRTPSVRICSRVSTISINERLSELGIELHEVPASIANCVPGVRSDNLVTTAGQVSVQGDMVWKGKLGGACNVEEALQATPASAINCLAAVLTVVATLDQVVQVVAVHGFVNSTPDNTEQAAAMNGASDLMVDVFGDAGRHARTAVGVSLPHDFTSSVYIVVEVRD